MKFMKIIVRFDFHTLLLLVVDEILERNRVDELFLGDVRHDMRGRSYVFWNIYGIYFMVSIYLVGKF